MYLFDVRALSRKRLLVWRQMSVKTDDFFLRDFTQAMTPSNTQLSIIYIFPHTLSFAILYHVFQNYSSCLSTTL